MLVILSPSKSVMKQSQPAGLIQSEPLFLDRTQQLISNLVKLNLAELKETLQISDSLARLNYDRYKRWGDADTRAALWMYGGDVYSGVDAYSMSVQQITYAQKQMLIVSGLYGLLRPLDAIQPYRLEMKLAFAADDSKNLYEFWQKSVNEYLQESDEKTILLCASLEYSKLIRQAAPKTIKLLTPRFMHDTDTGLIEKGLFAKYGRGSLARWVIDNKVDSHEDLKNFTIDGFTYSHEHSSENTTVFIIPKDFSLKGRFVKK